MPGRASCRVKGQDIATGEAVTKQGCCDSSPFFLWERLGVLWIRVSFMHQ